MALRNIVPLHPSVDLLWLHFVASDFENKLAFIDFSELSLLLLPNNRSHLLRLDIFVHFPLTYACPVLPQPTSIIVSAISLLCSMLKSNILRSKTELLFNPLLNVLQRYALCNVELDDSSFVRLPIPGTQSRSLPLPWTGGGTHGNCGYILSVAWPSRAIALTVMRCQRGIRRMQHVALASRKLSILGLHLRSRVKCDMGAIGRKSLLWDVKALCRIRKIDWRPKKRISCWRKHVEVIWYFSHIWQQDSLVVGRVGWATWEEET